MKETPILFSGPMVSAIRGDRKTQTRRVSNPRLWPFFEESARVNGHVALNMMDFDIVCPYGKPGDILICKETHYCWGKWVRNGLTKKGRPAWRFKSVPWTGESNGIRFCVNETRPFEPSKRRTKLGWHKRPSIFMPLLGARLRLELVSVRVERLQEISAEDTIAEGIYPKEIGQNWAGIKDPIATYKELWDSINARRDGGQFSWDKNPWVFALTFKKL